MTTTPTPPPAPRDLTDRRDGVATQAEKRWQRTVPERFRHAPTTAVAPEIEKWTDGLIGAAAMTRSGRLKTGPSLLLQGLVGRGKTHAAWWALYVLAGAGVLSTWEVTTEEDMYAALRRRSGVDTEAEYERYATTPLLVIDDLAAYPPPEWARAVLYRLINHRYNHMLPTVVTTNLPARRGEGTPDTVKVLAEEVDTRVLSRLAEMTGGDAVALTGPDRRRAD